MTGTTEQQRAFTLAVAGQHIGIQTNNSFSQGDICELGWLAYGDAHASQQYACCKIKNVDRMTDCLRQIRFERSRIEEGL